MPVTTRSSARRTQSSTQQSQRKRPSRSRSEPASVAVGARRTVASQPTSGLRRSSRISARTNLPAPTLTQPASTRVPTRRSARIAAQPPRNYADYEEETTADAEPTIVSFGERVEILSGNDSFAPTTAEERDSFSLRECASHLQEAAEMRTYWNQQTEHWTQVALESGASEDELTAAMALLSLRDATPEPAPLRRSLRKAAQRYSAHL